MFKSMVSFLSGSGSFIKCPLFYIILSLLRSLKSCNFETKYTNLKKLKINPIVSFLCIYTALNVLCFRSFAQATRISTIAGDGWAGNSVNTVVFRKNSLITNKNVQYAAYYDDRQYVVLAKRKLGTGKWQVSRTQYQGDAADAHKSISISVDGDGFLHLAWGQHNNQLNYCKSLQAGSLLLGDKIAMTGLKENKISYPEFYRLSKGDLLFFYRDGGSGNGNLMINRYDLKSKTWSRMQDGLIDGEGKRNAYWQAAIDEKDGIHLSWVWRENPDVASNHDLCYAKSRDGGKTWQKSTGENYTLPLNASNAEYAFRIPQKSELINQTSMYANAAGEVFIATYWRDVQDSIPQYQLVFKQQGKWKVNTLKFRRTPFTLSGGGTKSILVSRPQIVAWKNGAVRSAAIIFRDEERQNRISVAVNQDVNGDQWVVSDLSHEDVGNWEPSFDTELWRKRTILNLFVQKVIQIDGEGKADTGASKVQVLEWRPALKNVEPKKYGE